MNRNRYLLRALRKGTVMAFANASIILLIATIADAVRSVWTIVVIVLASALAYFAAYQEAKFDEEQIAREREGEREEPGHDQAGGEKPQRSLEERLEDEGEDQV